MHNESAGPMLHSIVLYCRPGFEKECETEFCLRAKQIGEIKTVSMTPASGYVVIRFREAGKAQKCVDAVLLSSLCFCRQMFCATDEIGPLPKGNRVLPVVEKIVGIDTGFDDVFIETADTNEAKLLSGLCKKLYQPFLSELSKQGISIGNQPQTPPTTKRLHVFFIATDRAYAGYSLVKNASSWHMGIPRLRFPSAAPSRSTLKLEEAFYVFMPNNEHVNYLKSNMTAVDLGASPGGWTWQFVNRGIKVIGVDNGKMDQQLLASGLVQHVRGDGFTYAPKRPVDWMVSDIVEQPSRIAKLAGSWVAKQWCRYTIFNLKLPMKKRFEEVCRCREIIMSELSKTNKKPVLAIKQLYHDREEVTGFLHL